MTWNSPGHAMGNISWSWHVCEAGYLSDRHINMGVHPCNGQELFFLQTVFSWEYSNLQSFKVCCPTGCTSSHEQVSSTYLQVFSPPGSCKAPLLTAQFAHEAPFRIMFIILRLPSKPSPYKKWSPTLLRCFPLALNADSLQFGRKRERKYEAQSWTQAAHRRQEEHEAL